MTSGDALQGGMYVEHVVDDDDVVVIVGRLGSRLGSTKVRLALKKRGTPPVQTTLAVQHGMLAGGGHSQVLVVRHPHHFGHLHVW